MPRRKPYTKVVKRNQLRADHIRGMGDVVFKGFQCLNSECREFRVSSRLSENPAEAAPTPPACSISSGFCRAWEPGQLSLRQPARHTKLGIS